MLYFITKARIFLRFGKNVRFLAGTFIFWQKLLPGLMENRFRLCYTDRVRDARCPQGRVGGPEAERLANRLKIALVDDEKLFLNEMEALCREYGQSRDCPMETFSFSGGKPFLAALKDTRFSIVFLDIYMADTDGIAAAKALREAEPGCILVFLTSSREFMPEAFSFHAFDYVSKPIVRERVEQVLDDARKVLPTVDKYIELIQDRKKSRIFLRDIVYAVTDGHYLEIALSDGSVLRSRMTASEFLQRTGGDPRFILANRGVILNMGHIRSFRDGCCIMEDGARLPLRVRDSRRVEQAVMDHNFELIRYRQNMGRNEK